MEAGVKDAGTRDQLCSLPLTVFKSHHSKSIQSKSEHFEVVRKLLYASVPIACFSRCVLGVLSVHTAQTIFASRHAYLLLPSNLL